MQKAREAWKGHQKTMDLSKLIFIDESSVNTGMTRLYGRALKGERVIDYVPDVRFLRTSVLSSIRLDGKQVPMVFEGSLNGEFFKEYVTQFLIPELQAGDIVVMDNLSSHKVKGIEEKIKEADCQLLYLPAYSPDLNPIENLWSKVKSYLRKAKLRTKATLMRGISEALSSVTISDVMGWFNHAGYSI